jgi:hypothetical protein
MKDGVLRSANLADNVGTVDLANIEPRAHLAKFRRTAEKAHLAAAKFRWRLADLGVGDTKFVVANVKSRAALTKFRCAVAKLRRQFTNIR